VCTAREPLTVRLEEIHSQNLIDTSYIKTVVLEVVLPSQRHVVKRKQWCGRKMIRDRFADELKMVLDYCWCSAKAATDSWEVLAAVHSNERDSLRP
jgi:hypothetical protein